eukprot:4188697-Pyramimonas_sp.AAC.1
MPLVAEPAAETTTATTSAGLPANEAWLIRMERAGAPCGSNPRRQRRTESPVSVRSGASAMSGRDMLQTVLMINSDGQNAVRADEDTCDNIPLTQQRPTWGEYPSDWILQQCPVTEEENRACMHVVIHAEEQMGIGPTSPGGHVRHRGGHSPGLLWLPP